MQQHLAVALVALTLPRLLPAAEPDLIPLAFSVDLMDRSVSPGVDFYRYASGQWLDTTTMPADKARWGTMDALAENNWRRIHGLLDELAATPAPLGSNAQKVGDFYRTALDTTAIDAAGITPLQPTFARIAAIADSTDLAAYVATAQSGLGSPLFGAYVYADQRDNEKVITSLAQGGLSLPNRDYYFDAKYAGYLPQFVDHMTTMLVLAGTPAEQARRDAETVLAFETKLAACSKTLTELRDPVANYHRMTRAEAAATMPAFSLETYLQSWGLPDSETALNVGQPDFFAGLSEVLASTPMSEVQTYLRWQALTAAAPHLAHAFEAEDFRFFQTVLAGTPQPEPRWQRAARTVDSSLGFALGEIYVARFFPPAVKDHLEAMIATMRDVLHDRITRLDWMSEPTKVKALAKLANFRVVVGYPPSWRDYQALTITPTDYFANVDRAVRFEHARGLAKLGQPFDKTEWLRTPQQVNAYYQPSAGQLVFLAGILQPPFFDPALDDAVNYGAICAVIGHEITHGFDDKGRNYDAQGNLSDWWTEGDATAFTARAQQLVDQYDGYEVRPGLFVKGAQTLGENIADLGGVTIAFEALLRSLARHPVGLIDGFTPEQRFFIAWAQAWRTLFRDDALKQRVATDVHAPGMVRAIGPLVNTPAFFQAFGIEAGDPMWRAPEHRIRIW